MADEVATFIRETERIRTDYKAIEARIIAHYWKDTWVNVGSRFVFSTEHTGRVYRPKKWIEKIGEMCLIEKTEPLDQFDRFMDVFRTGELTIDGKTIIYKRWTNQDWGSPYWSNFYRLRRSDQEEWSTSRIFAYTLRGGDSYSSDRERNEIRSGLESKLSSSVRTPFVSFTDFARDFLGPFWSVDVWGNPFAELLAPIDVSFAKMCELQDTKATFRCDVGPGYLPSEIRVGYATFLGEKALQRGRVKIVGPEGDKDTRTFSGTVGVSREAERVVLLLVYRDEEVDRLTLHRGAVQGNNPRMLLHARDDPQFEKFDAGIAARDRKGQDLFERSILLLFHFLGFSTVSPSPGEAVDVMAFTEDPTRLLLIECTTGAPGPRDKVGKLAARRTAYKRKAAFTAPVAILATSLEKEDIGPSDLERASQEGIIILAAENIRTLVSMANQGKATGAVMYYLRGLAPYSANVPI